VAEVTVDEQVTVRAVSQDRNWAVVEGPHGEVGWFPVSNLALDGSLAEASAVETAWVESNALSIRSGPGVYYDQVGTLAINTMVSILAIDEDRSWALVETQAGGQGWIQLRLLTLGGSLANVPEIAGPPPVQSDPASQTLAQAKPAITGQIVLQLASGGDIMAINADGTGLRRLTHGIDPALSPDGQTVAFTRWQGEDGSVWLTSIDGTHERQVLGFIKQPKGPAWSPDGSQLVINFQQGGALEERSVCKDLTQGGVRPPRNANKVTFSIDDKGDPELCWRMPPDPMWNLRVINPSDGSFEDYDGGTYAFRPTWDPANPWRVVSDGGRGLVQVDLNQEQEQPITENAGDSSPVFSPDGRYLAVTAGHPGGGQGYDIYRLNADGSGRVRLTQTPLWETTLPEEKKAWNNVAPAWSPDGLQIAFLTDRTDRWEIWVMNLDGSNQRPLFPDAINDQLDIQYNFVDERVLSWQ
jgi:dipeptidyl aminopeptidase/acylaminoacyl peptidase/SH3-like domain-containing protein